MAEENIENLEELLSDYLGANKEIVKTNISYLTAPGENFGSIILKLDLTLRNKVDGKNEILHTVAKKIPKDEVMQKAFNIQITYKNEVSWYCKIVPILRDFQKSLGIKSLISCFPEIYGARFNLNNSNEIDKDAVFVLENLHLSGFANIDRIVGFDLETTKLVLQSMAELHAVPLALRLKKPKLFEEEVKIYSHNFEFDEMCGIFDEAIKAIISQNEKCKAMIAKNGDSGAGRGSIVETPGVSTLDRNSNNSPRDGERQIATIESHPRPVTMPIPTVTCDLASDISTSDIMENAQDIQEQKDTLKVYTTTAQGKLSPLTQCQFRGSTLSVNGELQQQVAALVRCRQPSMGIDTDMVSEFDPSSSDSGVVAQCTAVRPLKLRLIKPIFGRANKNVKRNRTEGKKLKKSQSEKVIVEHVVPRVQKPRDPEREKRRIARKKEKRATLILGLIMGSFIACWLPFFCMYIIRLGYKIPGIAFSTAFWLGYMNSALNPVIYTIFNKDFRRAFRRILFK